MQTEQFEALKSLVMEVFDEASKYIQKHARVQEPDALEERLHDELVEEYPILRFADSDQKEAVISVLVVDGVVPPDENAEEFYLHILDKIKGRNKSHAYSNASLALTMLSNNYKSQTEISIDPN